MFLKLLSILLLFLSYFSAEGQNGHWYQYWTSPGMCSANMILLNDHSYIYEQGCEQGSAVNCGRWALKNDTLTLTPYDSSSVDVVDTMFSSGSDTGYISVTVFDKNGKDITEKQYIGIRVNGQDQISFLKKLPEMANQLMYVPRYEGSIALVTLESHFRSVIEFPITRASDYVIKLNIAEKQIFNAGSSPIDLGILRFRRMGSSFISIPNADEPALHFKRIGTY